MRDDVRDLLKRNSRSMYLSLAVLPAGVRDAMGMGYLFCRAADTIADTRLVPRAERLKTLERYREAFETGSAVRAALAAGFAAHQASASERELLERLGVLIELWKEFPEEERRLLRDVVFGVIDGMRMDLSLFPSDKAEGVLALPDAGSLDRYCAFIGGAPGLFWTDLCLLRLPELRGADARRLRELGLRLGKGLQITNILRDIAKDLRIGRCYLPEPELKAAGLSPADLLKEDAVGRLRPVLDRWLGWGLEQLEAGRDYVEAMPGLRLRAAAAWPLLLSFMTLVRVRRSPDLLRADRAVKVTRAEVYRLVASGPWTLSSDARFRRAFEALRAELAGALAAP